MSSPLPNQPENTQTFPSLPADNHYGSIFKLPLELRRRVYRHLVPHDVASVRTPKGVTPPMLFPWKSLEPLQTVLSSSPSPMNREIYEFLYDEYFFHGTTLWWDKRLRCDADHSSHMNVVLGETHPDLWRVKNIFLQIIAYPNYDDIRRVRRTVEKFVDLVSRHPNMSRIKLSVLEEWYAPSRYNWASADFDKAQQLERSRARGIQYEGSWWFDTQTADENGVYPQTRLSLQANAPHVKARCNHPGCGRDICILTPTCSARSARARHFGDRSTSHILGKLVSWTCSDAELILRPFLGLRNLTSMDVILPQSLRSHAYPQVEQLALAIETWATSDVPDLEITSDWNNLKEQARLSLLCPSMIHG